MLSSSSGPVVSFKLPSESSVGCSSDDQSWVDAEEDGIEVRLMENRER
jgi:hypothetical protein